MWLQGRRFAPVTISSRQMMQTLSMDCSSSGVASGYLWGYSGVRRQNPPKPAPKSHRDNERTPLRPPPLASIHHLLAQNPLLRGYPQPVSPQGRPNPFFRAKLSRSPPNLDQTHLELDPTPHKSPTKPAERSLLTASQHFFGSKFNFLSDFRIPATLFSTPWDQPDPLLGQKRSVLPPLPPVLPKLTLAWIPPHKEPQSQTPKGGSSAAAPLTACSYCGWHGAT